MLSDFQALLAAAPIEADLEDYRALVVEENVLGKRTLATRRASFRQLRELYGLSVDTQLFRALRDVWSSDPAAQPLLAMLCSLARDPILRATAPTVLDHTPGEQVTTEELATAIQQVFPDRYLESVRQVTARNLLASWRQARHITPAPKRERVRVTSRPTALAYALYLGHLCGERGDLLFRTLWAHALDTPLHILHEQAIVASRQGWIEYRHAGNVTEITFRHLERAGDTQS